MNSLFSVKQAHPSDEARMRILLEAMKLIGLEREAQDIRDKWNKMIELWGSPLSIYQYAFPSNLLKELAAFILEGFRKSEFSVISADMLNGKGEEIRLIFDKAWKKFWNSDYEEFRKWEKEILDSLKKAQLKEV